MSTGASAAGPGARGARRFESGSSASTEALGEALGGVLAAGDVLALEGELGSGKTTLVRGLARGLGVREPVSSPTFTLMHTYAGRLAVHHLDAWMSARGDAFLAEGGTEWLGGEGVAVVEWAGHVRAWLPADHLSVSLAHGPRARAASGGPAPGGSPTLRRIELRVEGRGPAAQGLAERLFGLRVPEGLLELPLDDGKAEDA